MNTRLFCALVVLSFVSGACGSTTAPSPSTSPSPTPTPPVTTYTLSGSLTATNGGDPLTAALDINGTAANAVGGAFSISLPLSMTGPLAFTISGPSVLTHKAYVTGGASRTVALDAIAQSGGFDLTFYRQLVRNALDSPGALRDIEVWHTPPAVYLQTIDQAGHGVDPTLLDVTESNIRSAFFDWTAGTFNNVQIVRGTDTRENASGWITIEWLNSDSDTTYCGVAHMGNGGHITFYERTPGCRCAGQPAVSAAVVRHEIGHMMGFFHTDSPADVMYYIADAGSCDAQVSVRERYHAAIALKRPNGNLDPDVDPSNALHLAPSSAQPGRKPIPD